MDIFLKNEINNFFIPELTNIIIDYIKYEYINYNDNLPDNFKEILVRNAEMVLDVLKIYYISKNNNQNGIMIIFSRDNKIIIKYGTGIGTYHYSTFSMPIMTETYMEEIIENNNIEKIIRIGFLKIRSQILANIFLEDFYKFQGILRNKNFVKIICENFI